MYVHVFYHFSLQHVILALATEKLEAKAHLEVYLGMDAVAVFTARTGPVNGVPSRPVKPLAKFMNGTGAGGRIRLQTVFARLPSFSGVNTLRFGKKYLSDTH
jgi:hypothetical protein